MKKFYFAAALFLLLTPLSVYGAEVFFNGVTLGIDVETVNNEDNVYIPIRQAADIISARLEWDDSTQTITVGKPFSKNATDILCKMTIDSTEVTVYSTENGSPTTLDAGLAPKLIDGKTYIPLDFFSDNPIAEVSYDGESINIKMDPEYIKALY